MLPVVTVVLGRNICHCCWSCVYSGAVRLAESASYDIIRTRDWPLMICDSRAGSTVDGVRTAFEISNYFNPNWQPAFDFFM